MSKTKTEDMIGKRYGRLVVQSIDHYEYDKNGWKRYYLLCKCDCGSTKVILAYSLTKGLTKSCGCYNKEKTGNLFRKHGKSNTRICHIWRDMHRRCENKNRKSYKRYGGRGITVCEDWSGDHGFENFYEWSMSHGYSDDLTIDRIDNDKGYSPDNCRWTDYQTQANNSSWNTWIDYNGEKHTLAEWGRICNLEPSRISSRIKNGWSIGESLGYEKHITHYKDEVLYTIDGETHNIREWCRLRGLSVDTVRYRREHNWTPEEIFGFKERNKNGRT